MVGRFCSVTRSVRGSAPDLLCCLSGFDCVASDSEYVATSVTVYKGDKLFPGRGMSSSRGLFNPVDHFNFRGCSKCSSLLQTSGHFGPKK